MKDKITVSMFGQKRLSREGGIEIVVKELCTRMVQDGCQITCYNRSGHHVSGAEYDRKTEYKGICQKFVPTIERKGLAAVSSSFFAALCSAFGKYDVVHIHAEGPAFFSWLPKIFGKRVVVTIHGIDWKREKWKSGFGSKFIRQGEKNAVKYADEMIVLSKGVQDRAFCNIVANQYYWKSTIQNVELMVHIGDISSSDYKIQAKEVWRVNPDGEIRDTFQKLYNVFEMKEVEFFEYYNKKKKDYSNNELLIAYHQEEKEILSRMPELPFSNIWIASVTAKKLPADSVLHLGIRNSLRSWNYFDTQETVTGYSNTGGFGIDGSLSTVIGAALCHPDRLYYCVLGDLAFFYDMNALGNRHVPSNIRILVVNNGLGFEMKFPTSLGCSIANSIGVSEDNYVCASGHYSQPDLIKSYVLGLGFEYGTDPQLLAQTLRIVKELGC